MLYYGALLLRAKGWSRATIALKKLSENCEEDNLPFLSFSAVNKRQGKKKPLI